MEVRDILTIPGKSIENGFGKALESLNTSFKIPKLQMVEASNSKEGSLDHRLRRDLAKSLSSNQTNNYITKSTGRNY